MKQIDARAYSSGNTVPVLSPIGIGCWSFGGGSYWGEQSQSDVDAVVHEALDLGITYFDTAEVYNGGASEVSLGKALRGRRSSAVIGTKVTPDHAHPACLRASCEASLRRLNTDYIDVFMLHWPVNDVSIRHFKTDGMKDLPMLQDVFDTMMALQKEGKIICIGISNHGKRQMEEVIDTGAFVSFNELPYNLLSRAIESEILPMCQAYGIGVIAYMPLLQGLLTGRYKNAHEVRSALARTRHFHRDRSPDSRHGEDGVEEEMFNAIRRIRNLANELQVEMTTLSLAWVMSQPGISTTIVGSRNRNQFHQNLKSIEFELPLDVRKQLDGITQRLLDKLGNSPDYYENRGSGRIW